MRAGRGRWPVRAGRGRRGAAALECAIVMMPLLLFLLGTVEYARFLFIRNLAENASREGARFAVVRTNDQGTSDVVSLVTARMAGQSGALSGMTISVFKADAASGANLGLWNDARFGQGVAVRVRGTYQPIVPLVMKTPILIETTSMMLSEAN